IWFKNATTCSDFTARAVPAILSGRLPVETSSAHWSSWPDNLFTLLAPTHDVDAAEWVTSMCPPDLGRSLRQGPKLTLLLSDAGLVYAHAVLPQPLRRKFPSVNHGWRAFGHGGQGVLGEGTLGQKTAHIDSFIDRIGAGDSPSFAFLHTVLPHRPYALYRSGKYYSATGSEPGGRTEKARRVPGDWVNAHAYQRHLLQAAYVDNRLGDILERWRDAGLYDQSLIVVVSDHGVSFRPKEFARHFADTNAAEILPVPLIMKLPGGARAGEVSMRAVETIDILPTIAGLLDIELRFPVDGASVLDDSIEPRAARKVVGDRTGEIHEFEESFVDGAQKIAMRRISMFGESQTEQFHHGDEYGLIGRRIDEFEIVPDGSSGFGVSSPGIIWIGEDDEILPGEVFGFVSDARRWRSDKLIAIAVDGVMRVTTSPYQPWEEEQSAVWYALLPENLLGPGEHEIEAYRVLGGAQGIRLQRSQSGDLAPSYLGRPLGREVYLGVDTVGILEGKRHAEDYVRLEVPMRDDEHPTSLRVQIEAMDEWGTDMTIHVNGALLTEQRIGAGDHHESFVLDDLVPGAPVRIELRGIPLSLDAVSDWTFGRVEMRLE
ncbi:hypothetical protein DRQ53_08835, partial [bacterium]